MKVIIFGKHGHLSIETGWEKQGQGQKYEILYRAPTGNQLATAQLLTADEIIARLCPDAKP